MNKTKELTLYLYNHHFVRYLLVGGTTFIIDFGLLYSLHSKFKVGLDISTTIAYWVSIVYNFILNRYWTFNAREKESLKKHLLIYCSLLLFNYAFVIIFISIMSHHINYIVAKAIAVLLQMIWTYPVYKKVIFVPLSLIPS